MKLDHAFAELLAARAVLDEQGDGERGGKPLRFLLLVDPAHLRIGEQREGGLKSEEPAVAVLEERLAAAAAR